MTIQQVHQFLDKVGEDEALQQELAKALQAEDDRQAATDLAKSKGYEFTPEELWAEVQKRQAQASDNEEVELTDVQLEAVAGGFNFNNPSVMWKTGPGQPWSTKW